MSFSDSAVLRDLVANPADIERRFVYALVEDDDRLPERVAIPKLEKNVWVEIGDIRDQDISSLDRRCDLIGNSPGTAMSSARSARSPAKALAVSLHAWLIASYTLSDQVAPNGIRTNTYGFIGGGARGAGGRLLGRRRM